MTFRTVAAEAALGLALTVFMLAEAAAAPPEAPSPATALDVCRTIAQPDVPGDNGPAIDPHLLNPDIRVEAQDLSGQNLAAKSFRGRVLIDVKFKGANLQGADFTDAVICGSDLTDTNLTAARLDHALIGGSTQLNNANFTNASARAVNITDASGDIRADNADLRGASIFCDPDEVRCLAEGIRFASVAGADLRGATISYLCCSTPGIAAAKLDGVITQFNHYLDTDMDFAALAAGVGPAGRITLIPDYAVVAAKTVFTGVELSQLATLVRQIQSTSARPSFDCSRAQSAVENAICAEPKLAALDSGLSWLWRAGEHTPQELSAQKEWLGTRANCPPPRLDWNGPSPAAFASPADPHGCIGFAYFQRIKQLAPKSSTGAVGSETYTTDRPLQPPKGKDSALAEKFLMARGLRQDAITITDLGTARGKISGSGLFANGHMCSLEAAGTEIKRVGSQFQIFDDATKPVEDYSVTFAITPQVVVRVGGNQQFQCGARGGWSDVYYRQPDSLVAKFKGQLSLQ